MSSNQKIIAILPPPPLRVLGDDIFVQSATRLLIAPETAFSSSSSSTHGMEEERAEVLTFGETVRVLTKSGALVSARKMDVTCFRTGLRGFKEVAAMMQAEGIALKKSPFLNSMLGIVFDGECESTN